MGHKVHPMGFRLGVIRDWQAKWYADKHYREYLQEDLKLRRGIQSRYADAAVSLVEIERQANKVSITIYTARPGIVIGRGGQRVDETRTYLEQLIGKRVQLNIQEVQRPELDAYLVARTIAEQIERRVAFRRAMKQTMLRTMQTGAKGMRVSCAGRLGGAEIARRLIMHEGQVPLHTLRADIDYGFIEAHTTMGRIGVKVWIYKGDVLPESEVEEAEEVPAVELEEKPAELVVSRGAEVAPSPEPTPEPEARKIEEAPAEPVAEVVPAVELEEKPAEPVKRTVRRARARPAPEPEAKKVEEAPKAKKAKKAPAEPVAEVESSTEQGEGDVTA
jgi:small subunit ribosomal protein S3